MMKRGIKAAVISCCFLALSHIAQTAPSSPAPQQRLDDGAEMVANGDLTGGTAGWSLVAEGEAQGSIGLDDTVPISPAIPHALRLTVTRRGQRCGVANSGQGGMHVRADVWYDAVFYARTENNRKTGLVFSLESGNGRAICARTTLPEIGGDWQQYTVSLHTRAANPKARLVISPVDPGVQWLGAISLRLRTSFPIGPGEFSGKATL